MTDPNRTALAVVLDRSGSIEDIRADIEGGLNRLIEDQKKLPGECDLMVAQFDTVYEVVVPWSNIQTVAHVPVVPRGSTALLDAMGRTINDTGTWLSGIVEDRRPGHVIMVIATDGEENASKEYTKDMINAMITHQRDVYAWEFLFLAANQDAIATGQEFGLPKGVTMDWAATPEGAAASFATASAHVGATRSGASYEITDEERAKTMAKSMSSSL